MTARLSHVDDGPPDAPVVVLGPSLGTGTGLFDAQVAALAGPFRVVRHDLRGHGGSEVVNLQRLSWGDGADVHAAVRPDHDKAAGLKAS